MIAEGPFKVSVEDSLHLVEALRSNRSHLRASPQQLMAVKHAHRTPTTPPAYTTASSTDTRDLGMTEYCSPNASTVSCEKAEARHSLAGQFPTVSLFKEYQDAAMALVMCCIVDYALLTMFLGAPQSIKISSTIESTLSDRHHHRRRQKTRLSSTNGEL